MIWHRSKGYLAALALGLVGAQIITQSTWAAEAESTAPQTENVSPTRPTGTRTDTTLPIEITADTLEVKQNQQLAVFRGKVDAVQGTMRLRADQLTVHYRESKESPDQPGISKIEAEGNVFVSSPTETGKGSRGIYDVDRARIDLMGDVVLTQGNNIVKGDTLEMNLTTGESKVAKGATQGGRVKGLFVPEKKPAAAKNDAPSQKKN